MSNRNDLGYFETDLISYYAPELSDTEILHANEFDQFLINNFKSAILPLSLIVLSNVLTVQANDRLHYTKSRNLPPERTWVGFAKDWTGISVLLKKDISKTSKILQLTRTLTGATSTICCFASGFIEVGNNQPYTIVSRTYAASTITYGIAWVTGRFFKK